MTNMQPVDLLPTQRPTVYVVMVAMHKTPDGIVPKHDLASAEKWGQLVPVMEWDDVRTVNVRNMTERAYRVLSSMTRDDYILLIGNPVAGAITAMVASDLCSGSARFLYWDRMTGECREAAVDLDAMCPLS